LRNLLLALVLTLSLTLTSFGQGRLVTELGDGFFATETYTEIGNEKFGTTEVTFPKLFLEDGNWSTGQRLALIKVFGCDSFKDCDPPLFIAAGGWPNQFFPPHAAVQLDANHYAHVFVLANAATPKHETIGVAIIVTEHIQWITLEK
jgi:hypothetical protein